MFCDGQKPIETMKFRMAMPNLSSLNHVELTPRYHCSGVSVMMFVFEQ